MKSFCTAVTLLFASLACSLNAQKSTPRERPFGGSMYGQAPANEVDRQKINAWILAPGNFDAVVDFAKVIADPQDATKMAPQFDSGDHLHPSPAGYKTMGESIPLILFEDQQKSKSSK